MPKTELYIYKNYYSKKQETAEGTHL